MNEQELDKILKGGVPRVKPEKEKKSTRFKAAWSKLAYRYDGGFSLTRLMMFFCFSLAGVLLLIGIICGIFGKVLPDNVYDYAFKMSLGGAGQYAITKTVEVITKVKGSNGEN